MLALSLLITLAAATDPVGLDLDVVGLSPLERAAVDARIQDELASVGAVVHANGLAACVDDACRKTQLEAHAARAGAVVRAVRVLDVLRVELVTCDRDGHERTRSSSTHDVAEPLGRLFDQASIGWLQANEPVTAPPRPPAPSPSAEGDRALVPVTIGGIAVGVLVAVLGGTVAGGQAVVANDPLSRGADKENARILGPLGVGVGAVGVVIAGLAGAALVGLLMSPVEVMP